MDLASIKSHKYVVHVVDSLNGAGGTGFTLKDSTDGRVILLNHPLPDSLSHNIPVTDGFKLLRGSVETAGGWKEWSIPFGSRRWSNARGDGLHLEGFSGAMGMGYETWLSSSSVTPKQLHSVLIKFTATDSSGSLVNPNDTTASFAYRYVAQADQPPAKPAFAQFIVNPGTGYAYQDYLKSVPFAAYDIDANRRLMVGFLENNADSGTVDGKYWPPPSNGILNNVSQNGPREWFFIFDIQYSPNPDVSLQRDILNNTLPITWWGTPSRRLNNLFSSGDQFKIDAKRPISSKDMWVFSLDSIVQQFVPQFFYLSQNYPNPFNPTTTIQYQLPVPSRVIIKIYNVLGQEVKTLVDGTEKLGFNSAQWNSTDNRGNVVASGVYFYRMETSSLTDPKRSTVQVKKMLVLR